MNEPIWRTHPQLKGLFHPENPDDLQVVVHEGGPRITRTKPELMWARVTGINDGVCDGTLLNAPVGLAGVRQGQTIRFIPSAGKGPPVYVTEKYLRERSSWVVRPCDKCGNCELFDAPSDLVRVIFPNIPAGATPEAFTSFCPLCGGVQVVVSASAGANLAAAPVVNKRWWQFWK